MALKVIGPLLKLLVNPQGELVKFLSDYFYKVFKISQLLNYMEKPNDTDRGLDKVKVENEMIKGQLKDMMDDINRLKNIESKAKKIRSL